MHKIVGFLLRSKRAAPYQFPFHECRPVRRTSTNAIAITIQIVRAIPTARFHETKGSILRASSKRCCTITKNPVFPIGANAAIQRYGEGRRSEQDRARRSWLRICPVRQGTFGRDPKLGLTLQTCKVHRVHCDKPSTCAPSLAQPKTDALLHPENSLCR